MKSLVASSVSSGVVVEPTVTAGGYGAGTGTGTGRTQDEDRGVMLVQLTMRQTGGRRIPHSPVDGIRIMALLPGRWHKDLTQATGDIVIRVRADDKTTSAEIRAQVVEILTNPEVSHWELVTCHTLPAKHHGQDPGPRTLRKEEER
ncbi:hypothetical protein N5079_23645 [Planotetraspora sp. A-T 1434]|uniref:hypothetical protein n=1 Tax=Planotetraspora sp. A-T 1434 TaxID=2979219 RepID=UPI0021BE6307|nr:hypothetical protein [Planotetraspora sp. A-T 1434]MCT9933208.1 hypothetical protein [Planotetraspora sp. A-T 1434]